MTAAPGTAMGMTVYEGAGWDRLMGEWSGWWMQQLDAQADWNREGLTLSQRAWRLVLNDPYSAALLSFVVGNVLGTGLQWQSHYQGDPDGSPTEGDLRVRRALTRCVREHSRLTRLDPGCVLTRRRLELQLLVSGFVAGDGFAVRVWAPDRPGCAQWATAWRVLDAGRVGNPDNQANVPGRMVDGIELRDGRPYALHWYNAQAQRWEHTRWWAEDGTRNVVHYAPDRARAGGLRGFSKYAPLLKLATHMARTAEAHVLGKRIQASHPMFIQSADPKASAELHRKLATRGANTVVESATIGYIGQNCDVKFPTYSYQGQDFDAFIKTQLCAFCAALGYPWQAVMCQLTDANLAAAQAALDQVDKTSDAYQDDFIAEVPEIIDGTILREAVTRGRVLTLSGDWDAITAGSYDRPRRTDANRLRSRQAATEARKLGVSPSTVHAELGYNFAEEVQRTAADLALAAAHGVTVDAVPAAPAPPTAGPGTGEEGDDTGEDDGQDEDDDKDDDDTRKDPAP